MNQKRVKAPTPARVNAFEVLSWTASTSENSLTLSPAQAAFFARIGLDVTRARLTAELAWGRG